MNIKDWTVCLIEPNKFEAEIILDLFRGAGVERFKHFTDSAAATQALELYPANIIVASLKSQPLDGVSWTKAFRRNHDMANRKAAIFLTSHAFSRAIAEECRHGGANALIGKPVSGATLLDTIKKVLANPRPFIDAPGYVGPCRRAGIVTAGAPKRRRKSDASKAAESAASAAGTLAGTVLALSNAVADLVQGKGSLEPCESALRHMQAYAVNVGDAPMTRACAAFATQLGAKGLRPEATKAAFASCVAGLTQLVEAPISESVKRDAIAEQVHQAVAKAALQKAA